MRSRSDYHVLQWARDRRNAERERDGDFGPDDYIHRGGEGGDDEIGETMLLVLLCVSVSVLLYIRQRLVDRMRRDNEEERQEVSRRLQPQQQQQQHAQPVVQPQPPPQPAAGDFRGFPAVGEPDQPELFIPQ